MTRSEILQIAKPILFNTDMVRAVLDGRKMATRRAVKYKYSNTEMKMRTDKYGTRLIEIQKDVEGETHGKNLDETTWHKLLGYIEPKPPYRKGDYLYVRETWSEWTGGYLYKAWWEGIAQPGAFSGEKWHPSIHMPKEAARIFLRVTDVRAERLQDMPHDGPMKEGIHFCECPDGFTWKQETDMKNCYNSLMGAMEDLWNATIPKKDLDKYGWDVNPWVWVIKFERVEIEDY